MESQVSRKEMAAVHRERDLSDVVTESWLFIIPCFSGIKCMDLQLSESSGLSLVYEGWEWGNGAGVIGGRGRGEWPFAKHWVRLFFHQSW